METPKFVTNQYLVAAHFTFFSLSFRSRNFGASDFYFVQCGGMNLLSKLHLYLTFIRDWPFPLCHIEIHYGTFFFRSLSSIAVNFSMLMVGIAIFIAVTLMN